MRPQMTVYLSSELRKWLKDYAKQIGHKESEIVRLLISRESRIRWLESSLNTEDPSQTESDLALTKKNIGEPFPVGEPQTE